MGKDIASELTGLLSAILDDCKVIKEPLGQYLLVNNERPEIGTNILRILLNATTACELLKPASESHGLLDNKFDVRHAERDLDWDFKPWLNEKISYMEKNVKALAKYWVTDLSTVRLVEGAPMSSAEWLHNYVVSSFQNTEHYASTVFGELSSGKLMIGPRGTIGNVTGPMYLNNHPTVHQLAILLASVNDDDADHTLWVGIDGLVHLDPIGAGTLSNRKDVRFRSETYMRGNGYVGREASGNEDYVKEMFDWLVSHWDAGSIGYLDS